jgi:hypothetical protein
MPMPRSGEFILCEEILWECNIMELMTYTMPLGISIDVLVLCMSIEVS